MGEGTAATGWRCGRWRPFRYSIHARATSMRSSRIVLGPHALQDCARAAIERRHVRVQVTSENSLADQRVAGRVLYFARSFRKVRTRNEGGALCVR